VEPDNDQALLSPREQRYHSSAKVVLDELYSRANNTLGKGQDEFTFGDSKVVIVPQTINNSLLPTRELTLILDHPGGNHANLTFISRFLEDKGEFNEAILEMGQKTYHWDLEGHCARNGKPVNIEKIIRKLGMQKEVDYSRRMIMQCGVSALGGILTGMAIGRVPGDTTEEINVLSPDIFSPVHETISPPEVARDDVSRMLARIQEFGEKYDYPIFQDIINQTQDFWKDGWANRLNLETLQVRTQEIIDKLLISGASNPELIRKYLSQISGVFPGMIVTMPDELVINHTSIDYSVDRIRITELDPADPFGWFYSLYHEISHGYDINAHGWVKKLKEAGMPLDRITLFVNKYVSELDGLIERWINEEDDVMAMLHHPSFTPVFIHGLESRDKIEELRSNIGNARNVLGINNDQIDFFLDKFRVKAVMEPTEAQNVLAEYNYVARKALAAIKKEYLIAGSFSESDLKILHNLTDIAVQEISHWLVGPIFGKLVNPATDANTFAPFVVAGMGLESARMNMIGTGRSSYSIDVLRDILAINPETQLDNVESNDIERFLLDYGAQKLGSDVITHSEGSLHVTAFEFPGPSTDLGVRPLALVFNESNTICIVATGQSVSKATFLPDEVDGQNIVLNFGNTKLNFVKSGNSFTNGRAMIDSVFTVDKEKYTIQDGQILSNHIDIDYIHDQNELTEANPISLPLPTLVLMRDGNEFKWTQTMRAQQLVRDIHSSVFVDKRTDVVGIPDNLEPDTLVSALVFEGIKIFRLADGNVEVHLESDAVPSIGWEDFRLNVSETSDETGVPVLLTTPVGMRTILPQRIRLQTWIDPSIAQVLRFPGNSLHAKPLIIFDRGDFNLYIWQDLMGEGDTQSSRLNITITTQGGVVFASE